jgi:hypothetical protein
MLLSAFDDPSDIPLIDFSHPVFVSEVFLTLNYDVIPFEAAAIRGSINQINHNITIIEA